MDTTLRAAACFYRRHGKKTRGRLTRLQFGVTDVQQVAEEARRQEAIAAGRLRLNSRGELGLSHYESLEHRRWNWMDTLRSRSNALRRELHLRRMREAEDRRHAPCRRLAALMLAHRPRNSLAVREWRAVLGGYSPEFTETSLCDLAVEAVAALLRRRGWKQSHRSESRSLYLERGGSTVRLSSHELPMTPERQYNWERGRKCCSDEIVVLRMGTVADWRRVLRQAVEICRAGEIT